MRFRFPAWGVVVGLAVVCAAAVGFAVMLRSKPEPSAAMLARLPLENATVLSVDFAALRQAGLLRLLSSAGGAQDPEYRAFVGETGFDYQQDLDLALVSFAPEGTYYVLRGRFDWKSLAGYAAKQGGSCWNTFCRMPGSTPRRWISFLPIHQNVMALAVSPDPWAAQKLSGRRPASLKDTPSGPVWALVSAAALRDPANLPAAARLFTEPLAGAERIAVSLGPKDNRIELLLDVTCRDARAAGSLAGRLTAVTAAMRAAKDQAELASVLAGGAFTQQDRRVIGRWPLERKFFESLAGGPAL